MCVCVCVFINSFPGGSDSKESTCTVSGEWNDYPLQCSGLENPMDKRDWWAIFHGVAESDTTEQLSLHFIYVYIYFKFQDITE